MKRIPWLLVFLGLVLLVLLGPRETVNDAIPRLDVPSDPTALTEYLAAAEAAFDDITPGAEKRIVWATPDTPAKTDLALVYLHGFSATRQETAPLAESLASALGANLLETRLTGHGRPGEHLGAALAEDWIADTVEAIMVARQLGERVVLLGVSTGATLAAWAATESELAESLHALLFVSPNFGPSNAAASTVLLPWARLWVPLVNGPTRTSEPESEAHGRYWTTEYPITAVFPMMALVDHTNQADLEAIGTPVLFIYHPGDETVDVTKIREAYDRFGSPRKEVIQIADPGDDHVIAGDIRSPQTTARVRQAMEGFLRGLEN